MMACAIANKGLSKMTLKTLNSGYEVRASLCPLQRLKQISSPPTSIQAWWNLWVVWSCGISLSLAMLVSSTQRCLSHIKRCLRHSPFVFRFTKPQFDKLATDQLYIGRNDHWIIQLADLNKERYSFELPVVKWLRNAAVLDYIQDKTKSCQPMLNISFFLRILVRLYWSRPSLWIQK